MNNSFLDSQALPQQRRLAPPVARALRILVGLALAVYVVPVYFRVDMLLAMRAMVLTLSLIGVYSLIHVVASRRIVAFGTGLGAIVALGPLVALYLAGGSGAPILGHGEGALAAVTFLAISLMLAGVRADPGCEVTAIPSAIFGRHSELTCLVFSPLDQLERKLRSKRAV